MSPLLIAFLGVLLVPLFVATWRTSLLGLACQGFLMAWIAWRMVPDHRTASDWITMADLVLVRGLGAPLALRAVLRAHGVAARNDVIPPNMLSWTLAIGIVLLAFNTGEILVPQGGQQQTLVAVAMAAVLIGFLLLATGSGPLTQMIGAIRVENGIALFELGGERHHESLGVQLGQVAIVAVTFALFRWYLAQLVAAPEPVEGAVEEPTL